MTDDQIKHMTNRFLSWRLPENFNPDGGISYQRPNYDPSVDATPTGTNLFDATQTEAMVRHMAEGMPRRQDLQADLLENAHAARDTMDRAADIMEHVCGRRDDAERLRRGAEVCRALIAEATDPA